MSVESRPLPAAPPGLPDPSFDANAVRVLEERYLARREDGTLESPKELLWRVAAAIAAPEAAYAQLLGRNPEAVVDGAAQSFYGMMCRRDFLPNTPCLVNAGRPLSMLSACFVLPVADSIEGIFAGVKAMATIQKSGGGTGFSFSHLRGRGADVASTGREASGPVSFMKVFNAATDSIKQGGVRRGANMGVLRIDHPDIFAFLRCKAELDAENLALYDRLAAAGRMDEAALDVLRQELLQSQLRNFNLSVGVTDRFMHAVETDSDFDLIDARDGHVVRVVRARDLWDAIVEGAWLNGEPGVLFLDHPDINPLPGLGPIEATNPCGEQFLHGNDLCTLGSINVGHFFDGLRSEVDWTRLGDTIALAIRFLDNVIDASAYPLEEIHAMARGNRRLGLGIMGFADLLVQLEIPYGSEAAIALAEKLMKFMRIRAEDMSEQLARERGEFPNKHLSKWADDPRPRRNAALLSIAPTGTISMLAGASFGCEPYFGMAYTKHVMKDAQGRAQQLYYIVPQFEEIAYDLNFLSDELLAAIEANGGSVRGLPEVPEDLQRIFTTTVDLSVDQHIDMLAAFQKHTCNAVSKSINAPHRDTRENVARAIFRAYHAGCKGFTYYRDGSRTEQVVTFARSTDNDLATAALAPAAAAAAESIARSEPAAEVAASYRKRPAIMRGRTLESNVGCGKLYVTLNEDEVGRPFEVFFKLGKSGSCQQSYLEALGVAMSVGLRYGADPMKFVAKFEGMRCPNPKMRNADGPTTLSCADGISQALARAIRLTFERSDGAEHERAQNHATALSVDLVGYSGLHSGSHGNGNGNTNGHHPPGMQTGVGMCPRCGGNLVSQGGCVHCLAECGYIGKCG